MSILRNGLQSSDLDVPVVLPTLNLDFANSQNLDPRITFSRGSIGTFVNKNGLIETASANIPRFDYDPISGECRGLLIEESRQNLFAYSETSTGWDAGSGNTSQNVIISPNETQTANKLNVGSSTFLQIINSPSATVSNTHTFSVFLKAGELKYVQLRVRNAGNINNYFRIICNLITGELTSGISNGTGTYTSASATKFPNDWWRFTVTGIADTSGTQITALLIGQINSSTVASVSNSNPTNGFYWWGAQLETGAFPTSYIPTSGSTVTRSADNANMTGTNFSSWYNQTEGTIKAEYIYYSIGTSNQCPFSFDNGTNQETIVEANNTNAVDRILSSSSGVSQANTGTYNYSVGQTIKRTVSYGLNNFRTSANGSSVSSDISYILPTPTQLSIGHAGYFITSRINGCIKRFTYYPKALSPSQLQYLTQ